MAANISLLYSLKDKNEESASETEFNNGLSVFDHSDRKTSLYIGIIRICHLCMGISIVQTRFLYNELQFFPTLLLYLIVYMLFKGSMQKIIFLIYNTKKLDYPALSQEITKNRKFNIFVSTVVIFNSVLYCIITSRSLILMAYELLPTKYLYFLFFGSFIYWIVFNYFDHKQRMVQSMSILGLLTYIGMILLCLIQFMILWNDGKLKILKPYFTESNLDYENIQIGIRNLLQTFVFGVMISPIVGQLKKKNNIKQLKKFQIISRKIILYSQFIVGLTSYQIFGVESVSSLMLDYKNRYLALLCIINLLTKLPFFINQANTYFLISYRYLRNNFDYQKELLQYPDADVDRKKQIKDVIFGRKISKLSFQLFKFSILIFTTGFAIICLNVNDRTANILGHLSLFVFLAVDIFFIRILYIIYLNQMIEVNQNIQQPEQFISNVLNRNSELNQDIHEAKRLLFYRKIWNYAVTLLYSVFYLTFLILDIRNMLQN